MKLTLILGIFLLLYGNSLFATEMKDIQMFGYARAGVGTNTLGGDQECFYNQGAGGWGGVGRNEFRLGNECTNYLELGFKFNHLNLDKDAKKWAYTQIRIANSHNGSDATESSSQSTNFVELYSEAYGLNDLPVSFWVGKRFYRDQDVHIDDYYYFGSTNGNGAGVGNIKIFNAELFVAVLKNVSDSTVTNKGKQGLSVLDARLKGLPLTTNLKENFWVAFGSAPAGTDTSTHTNYDKTNGVVVGTLFDYNLGSGFNHFSVSIGHGVMNTINLYGDSSVQVGSEANLQNNKNRIRLLNHTTYKLNSHWQGHLALTYENLYNKNKSAEEWMGISARPIYIVSDHFQILTEFGSSLVNFHNHASLTRVALAPQLSLNSDIWGRPALRVFYSHSFWNDANKTYIAQNASSFASKNAGGNYGFQVETSF